MNAVQLTLNVIETHGGVMCASSCPADGEGEYSREAEVEKEAYIERADG
jgi:hypothetical protein